MTRIRTLDFLPSIFQTETNSQFLAATLDQLVNPPVTRRIEGFIGSKLGYGINAKDYYVTEPTKQRRDYQLEPGVVFLKNNETVAKDFISYPGILDALKLQDGITNNNNRLFESQFYSWDSFTNLDTIINYNQYYWIPNGPPPVTVTSSSVYLENEYVVTPNGSTYTITPVTGGVAEQSPIVTLLRGGTYSFTFQNSDGTNDTTTQFWIQGEPTSTGASVSNPNINTRNVFGVTNNGRAENPIGPVVFNVPQQDAQDEYNFQFSTSVDLICTKSFSEVNGVPLSTVNDIDGVTDLNGRTILFYKADPSAPGVFPNEYFYTISIVSDTVLLTLANPVPASTTINVLYGTNYLGTSFFKDVNTGNIGQIPYISSVLSTLYYQDGTVPERKGVIQLIFDNNTNTINVDQDILGQTNYTSKNDVVFTNGLKVTFQGDIVPARYLEGEYYVQGVGTSIELVPVQSLIVPEPYTTNTSIPYDMTNYDITGYDEILYSPTQPDYITIARNAISYNAWSRSNRWFHIDVIRATATYNNDPTILTTYATATNKAKRPIIEFYPNINLFNSGLIGKEPVDFVDDRTTDIGNQVSGQAVWYPDVDTYTEYTGTISTNPTLSIGNFIGGQLYKITSLGTTGEDTWVSLGAELTLDGQFTVGYQYIITNLGLTDWAEVAGTDNTQVDDLELGKDYIITDLGDTTQAEWNLIAGTSGVTYIVGSTFTSFGTGIGTGTASQVYSLGEVFTAARPGTISGSGGGKALYTTFTATGTGIINSSDIIPGLSYTITTLGTTVWTVMGAGLTPYVGQIFTPTSSGIGTGTATQGTGTALALTTTTISIPAVDITSGTFTTGMYINDLIQGAQSVLPPGTRILEINSGTNIVMTVNWLIPTIVSAETNVAFVASNKNQTDLILYSGARIVFKNETNETLRNKIYVANYSVVVPGSYPVITLTEALDGQLIDEDQFVVLRGANYQGVSLYLRNGNFAIAQEKPDINIAPKFDVYDENGISFGDLDYYESSTFDGSTLFEYLINPTGVSDSILGFPVSYSSINNVGDIRFNVSLNTDTFNFVTGPNQTTPATKAVNTGYVHNFNGYKGAIIKAGNFKIGTTYRIRTLGTTDYTAIGAVSNTIGDEFIATGTGAGSGTAVQISESFFRDEITRLLGWQTAVAPSVQYQVFEFKYTANNPPLVLQLGDTIGFVVTCDVPQLSTAETTWPSLQVYNNNSLLIEDVDYTVVNTTKDTRITINLNSDTDTEVQVLILSDTVSNNAYYSVPVNLTNNPFNTDVTSIDTGDIRGQYQSIFTNNPDTTGEVFGPNNFRDLGNLVPWGTRIIQNSASFVLPGAFLRTSNHNLFDALMFNSKEYIKFKTLLIDTVNQISWDQQFDPANLLDEALDRITSVKSKEMPFFWSDMVPNKAAYLTNVYNLFNNLDVATYPLSKIYDFTTANYDGILVYVQTTIAGTIVSKQLFKDIDYTVSTDSPTLTITKSLNKGDSVIIKEYNQTYGSYIPNTPSKLGLYPVTIPTIFQDTSYQTPTWFIIGHDGSFNKLYGQYNETLGVLTDFRDQALFEFETRVYNNLKLSNVIPIDYIENTPGYFRETQFSYEEWLAMYSPNFLNWVGQNRLDYKTQIFRLPDQYTWNYRGSRNNLNQSPILQGYWRGIYQYYYDTSTPDQTPWEMIGFTNKPSWWESRYGAAPYTSDNLVLWEDLAAGRNWNNGNPVILDKYKRPDLLSILPVDENGDLLEPAKTIVGAYNSKTLQKDWNVGDDAPVELSYRRSSTFPFDFIKLLALMKPTDFFNLAADLDNYKYNEEFNQYLVDNISHLVPQNIEIYGNGTAKTSYINWIVDYEKQLGVDATQNISNLLKNIDVRLVYRMAGFSDKTLLKFFVEKGTPGSRNQSLLIPDESYQVLLYENQSYDKLVYSSVIVQKVENGFKVFGNGQTINYFRTLKPKNDGANINITVQDQSVEVSATFTDTVELIPYGNFYFTTQQVCQFLLSYGAYLTSVGANFDTVEQGTEITWQQMAAEFLYWSQVGWSNSSLITLNPAATTLKINRESQIVQPLTYRQNNFVLNQNLYPIENRDLSIFRDGTEFVVSALNPGDTLAYGQFNLSNWEHGVVFDNVTLFNDTIYNLISGLKQNRIYVRGTKSAEWNGTMFASGFIYNQDNIQEWKKELKYTKGEIVKYKNKYWTALKIVQPSQKFNDTEWAETEYDEIQKGLLPNPSTRSAESVYYYNDSRGNLESDADQLAFSLIGFRNRPYMESADLTDITQVNLYKNLIKQKGTPNSLKAFKGAQLPQGGIDYEIYENWAIKSGEFGGILNSNFVEFKLNQNLLTGNPGIVGVVTGNEIQGAQQLVPLYSLFNYGRPITNTNIFPLLTDPVPNTLFPNAGYVNFNDVKMSSYFYSGLPAAVNSKGLIVPINNFYVRDFVWIANYLSQWQVLSPNSIGQVIQARSNANQTTTLTFKQEHNLSQYDIFSIINFDDTVNGYYIALQILNPFEIIINLSLPPSSQIITGEGIGLKFVSQRVEKPSDIENLPLLNFEFIKNTVWVDENSDGGWAVYRKNINYTLDKQFTRIPSEYFGSAVAYTVRGDYLIGDRGEGKVYRYQYDGLTETYEADQVITGSASFGSSISHEQNIFVISQPTTSPKLQLYVVNDTTVTDDIIQYQTINASDNAATTGSTNFGSATALSGDTNWLYVSDYNEATPTARNKVHVYRKRNTLTTAGSFVAGATYRIETIGTTNFVGIGAVTNEEGIVFKATGAGTGTGTATRCDYQYMTTINGPTVTVDKFGYSLSTDYYGETIVVGAPTEDYDINTSNWGKTYVYDRLVQNIETQNDSGASPATFELAWTPDPTLPLFVSKNGTLVDSSNYSVSGTNLIYSGTFETGDIINVSGNECVLVQILTTETDPRVGVQFGYSNDNSQLGTEILVGAPFALSTENNEGAVYRYTYGAAKYGYVIGSTNTNITASRKLLLNGYLVTIPVGNAEIAATAINNANITNIEASANNGKITISLINQDLAQADQALVITVTDKTTLTELGFNLFTQTQVIENPHNVGPSQFGTVVKFNEFNSVAISAPVDTRFAETLFDFIDDANLDNDTVFDNNATQFIETFANAGSVYLFDYLANYNESLLNIGKYIYGQSCNSDDLDYGAQPRYGTVIDFSDNKVIIGTPNYRPDTFDGQVTIFVNETGLPNWTVYRQSSEIVDIDRVQNMQIFSAETNQTLINLDYIDPLQGKILGAVRENLDIISNVDPASYNNSQNSQSGFVWGEVQEGVIWFDTTNIRYVNYHQNDNVYNSKYWGTLFPGSDVAVYTWTASPVPPIDYAGPGTVKNIDLFTVQSGIDSSNNITPVYYFWVRNTGVVVKKRGKSLADNQIAQYISNPQGSGISYLAPLLSDAVALYNCQPFINANDSVLHVGFSTGTNDDPGHVEYQLIRANYKDDFLPGVPNINDAIFEPNGLYDRMLDSLCGVDETGNTVPDPLLPKAVQSGVLARPRQSFVFNRLEALENYLQFANTVLAQYPIAEIRPNATFLTRTGEYYDTANYWDYINWWAVGYNNNTKATMQVPRYADLQFLNVPVGTIVTVASNSAGNSETYIFETVDDVNVWTRIGLQNGTVKLSSALWDYEGADIGFGDGYFSTETFDSFPSEETRWILRALNEQIYTGDLLIYRNQSLILLFEYIQAETTENQNYLPWLNKTSLVDVNHKVRELQELRNYISDNQELLEGYVNEVKPFHVVVKEFIFTYEKLEAFNGNITDFDVPAEFNTEYNKFISPQLVYTNPSNEYEFLPTAGVWDQDEYTNWYNSYGISLTGEPNYQISKLMSYVSLASKFMIVESAQGFPTTGIIKLVSSSDPNVYEYISYSRIDKATNTLSGLLRGLNNTENIPHIPGESIYIDLSPVIVLEGGRGYTNPPRVIANIDRTLFPAPREAAQLEAEMVFLNAQDGYKVNQITVTNPGSGYAELPTIDIDPAFTYDFTGSNVNTYNSTILLNAPELRTGDLVRYVAGLNGSVAGLKDLEWYYINVLDTTSGTIIGLYTSYKDAVYDQFRVNLDYTQTATFTHEFYFGARAIAISTSYPIRENNITLKYDRTSYNSQITDWSANSFYSGPYTGSYATQTLSSSSIELESTTPLIDNMLASAGGFVLPILSSTNNRELEWSGFERFVSATSASDIITLVVENTNDNASGSTIGFTVGMPIKFTGYVGSSGITANTTYYIAEVVNDTQFKISATQFGSVLNLNTQAISPNTLKAYTADIVDTAVLTVEYPGIREVTATTDTNNIITVANSAIGTAGTKGFYTGLPLMFTGGNLGNITENLTYFVTSVIDDTHFTMSLDDNPVRLEISSINTFNQIILESTVGLSVNDAVIFDTMKINDVIVSNFGNIIEGTIYYIKEVGNNFITISTTIGGIVFTLSQVLASATTYCFVVNQKDTLNVTTATGNITLNVSLPVSPGQIDEKLFTFYPLSNVYNNLPPVEVQNLVDRNIAKTLTASNLIAITNASGGIDDMYIGLPFNVSSNIGGLVINTNYSVQELGRIEVFVSGSSSVDNSLTCSDTDSLYVDMPVVFSGAGIGGVVIGYTYYIANITSATKFTIKETLTGSVKVLTTSAGSMTGTGEWFIRANATITSNASSTSTKLVQKIITEPTFDIDYTLGGYRVVIDNTGTGFTLNNTLRILGTSLGGTTPENDCYLTVNGIDAIIEGEYPWSLPVSSNGEITSVIVSGTPNGVTNNYYVKVLSDNTLALYYDALFQQPVSGIGLPYGMGSYGYIPEPFNFKQSIVKYNNRVYACLISNNDSEFAFGKWELLDAGNSKLNALDRVVGWYSPTVNMPGNDLQQIFTGLTYPNTTYKGNEFDPNDQFTVDTTLTNEKFYPKNVDMVATAFNGINYVIPANLPTSSGIVADIEVSDNWIVGKLSDQPLELTDILRVGNVYIMTSTNSATPLFTSSDAMAWSTNGFFIPYGNNPDEDIYLKKKLIAADLSLSSITNGPNLYMVSGSSILSSDAAINWREVYKFGSATFVGSISGTTLTVSSISSGTITQGMALSGLGIIAGTEIVEQLTSNTYQVSQNYTTSVNGITITGTDEGHIYDIQYVTTNFFTGYVGVGTRNGYKLIVYSTDGITWNEVSNYSYDVSTTASQRNAALKSLSFTTNSIIAVGDLGVVYKTTNISQWTMTYIAAEPLNDILFKLGKYITVGDGGLLLIGSDGTNWFPVTTPTLENLNRVYYEPSKREYTIVGNNNTVLQASIVITAPTTNWDTTQVFTRLDPAYTVKGSSFEFGYGPEEMVPGVVTDQLTMIVNTRPGTNWSVSEYQHVGYNSVSVELDRDVSNVYSFDDIVEIPALVNVFKLVNGLSTTLYKDVDYTINYVDKTITLDTPLSVGQKLRVDVYEVGNGNQLVKSNTQNDPLIVNTTTGFDEIYLDCNYSQYEFAGSGLVRPTTAPISDFAISTDSATNSITVTDITKYSVNDDITFAGDVYGGVVQGTTYYVKTINTILNTITISDTIIGGIAGPVFGLSDGSGTDMTIIIQPGQTDLWAQPAVFKNGDKLVAGISNTIIRTLAGTNSCITYSTQYMTPGQSITFDKNAFGGLTENTTYTIDSIISATEFSLVGVTLTNDYGTSTFITNDLAVVLVPSTVTAKVIFAEHYNTLTDYIAFSFFGESEPTQYGYTLPSIQNITGTGSQVYDLTNYLNEGNKDNAIVEINGLRLMPDDYVVSDIFDTITFDNPVSTGATISVTTFNDTKRQAINTQDFTSTVNVIQIQNVLNTITPVLNEPQTDTSDGTYFIADSTTGMVLTQNVMFQVDIPGSGPVYTSFGGVLADGTVYTLSYFDSVTKRFQVQDENGVTYPTSAGTGLMHVVIGGQPAVRVITADPHGYSSPVNNDIQVRIDGLTGSVQLNNNEFYIHVINETTFDLYTEPYQPYVDSTNYPVTLCDSYISGGYVWTNNAFNIINDYEQTNVDRLWVTVNGYRVASSNLVINPNNYLSILVPISIGDDIIITSMIPTATPDSLTYINIVNKDGVGTVYRANSKTRTWVTKSVGAYDTTITVESLEKITNTNISTQTTPAATAGYYYVPLIGDKDDIINVQVYNNNPSRLGFINRNFISIQVTGQGPFVKIQPNAGIQVGDVLTITELEGGLLYINGEYMRITGLDTVTKVVDVQRGYNGSSIVSYIPKYSEVFSLLEDNKMSDTNYNKTWNPIPGVYNTTKGDPLQIADTASAAFLRTDIT